MQSIVKREGEQKNAPLINIKSQYKETFGFDLSMVLEKCTHLIFILMSGLKLVDLILEEENPVCKTDFQTWYPWTDFCSL